MISSAILGAASLSGCAANRGPVRPMLIREDPYEFFDEEQPIVATSELKAPADPATPPT